MVSQEDVVFAKVAIRNHLLSNEQAAACLKEVNRLSAEGRRVLLSDVAVARNFLSQDRVDAVSRLAHYQMVRARDRTNARMLVAKGLVSQVDVDAVLETQQALFKQSRRAVTIADILVDRGLLGRGQVSELLCDVTNEAASEGQPRAAVVGLERTVRAGLCRFVVKTYVFPDGQRVSCIGAMGRLETVNAREFQSVMRTVLSLEGDEGKYVILDLGNVSYMSSSGVGIIAAVFGELSEKGGALVLADVPAKLEQTLAIVGLDVVPSFGHLDAALEGVQASRSRPW